MPRPIDATRLVKLVLEERDKIPLEVVERYSFGVPSPNKHGQSMRGGIRKVLRLIEQAPTLDYAPIRHGEWVLAESPYAEYEEGVDGESHDRWTCSLCGGEAGFDCDPDGFASFQDKTKFCGHCGAKMDAQEGNR